MAATCQELIPPPRARRKICQRLDLAQLWRNTLHWNPLTCCNSISDFCTSTHRNIYCAPFGHESLGQSAIQRGVFYLTQKAPLRGFLQAEQNKFCGALT